MAKVVIYTKSNCPYCVMAKELLQSKHILFEEIKVDHDAEQLEIMMKRSNRRTVPQIFIDDQSIGGFDDLATLAKSGKLDEKLN